MPDSQAEGCAVGKYHSCRHTAIDCTSCDCCEQGIHPICAMSTGYLIPNLIFNCFFSFNPETIWVEGLL